MPLLDHFHPPLAPVRQWGSIHSAWANTITQQLNRDLLPPEYVAQPRLQLGNQCEIDVATLHTGGARPNGAVATATWAPPRPGQTVAVRFVQSDQFEVQVFEELGGLHLRAAIEILSPANKDRPRHRRNFALKCANFLEAGASVILIDVVTNRSANLHAELMETLEVTSEPLWQSPTSLYAAAYRIVLAGDQHQLEIWPEALALGATLPTLPLWLNADLCLPLRLEESYRATCDDLRIPR